VDRINAALHIIGDLTERRANLPTRVAGRLRARLSFSQIEEVMAQACTRTWRRCAANVRKYTLPSVISISIIRLRLNSLPEREADHR